MGITDLHGVDGDYVDRQILELPQVTFTAIDLNGAFDLGRQFDLVQSLEVGEHIQESASETFAECLAHHARRYILFSAAPPGQGGEYHINEQPYEFWRQKFERRGFVTIDAVRPAIAEDKRISYWYRYNTLLFVRRDLLLKISNDFRDKMVRASDQIKDLSPLAFRLRKAVVGRLPNAVQHEIARLKSKAPADWPNLTLGGLASTRAVFSFNRTIGRGKRRQIDMPVQTSEQDCADMKLQHEFA